MKSSLLDRLYENAVQATGRLPSESLLIKGIWHTEYIVNLSASKNAAPLNLGYVIIQTDGQGCSYYDPTYELPGISEKYLNRNVLEVPFEHRCLRIASLDAVFANLVGKPSEVINIHGSNVEKSFSRANLIANEAWNQLSGRRPKNGDRFKIVNVGVVSDILRSLSSKEEVELSGSDFYSKIVGTKIFEAKIHHGSETNRLVAESDLAIVTGMTLATNTLSEILDVAEKSNTRIVVFAETGHNFASEYLLWGADAVVSEPFPFYLSCHGNTEIRIFRR